MTDWKENESYLHMKLDVQNETFILQISNVHSYDETAKTYE